MSVQSYAIVSTSGNVLNVVLWDGATPFSVAPNILVPIGPNAAPGGTYAAGIFSAPVPAALTVINTPAAALTKLGNLLTPEIATLISVVAGIVTTASVL